MGLYTQNYETGKVRKEFFEYIYANRLQKDFTLNKEHTIIFIRCVKSVNKYLFTLYIYFIASTIVCFYNYTIVEIEICIYYDGHPRRCDNLEH